MIFIDFLNQTVAKRSFSGSRSDDRSITHIKTAFLLHDHQAPSGNFINLALMATITVDSDMSIAPAAGLSKKPHL